MNAERVRRWFENSELRLLALILFVAWIALVVCASMYYMYFNTLSTNNEDWARFGDYFGGTLNPIFGFLSIIALLATLVIQSKELRVSSKELRNSAKALEAQNRAIEHQSFEQTFFSWLQTYRELLESVEITIFRRDQAIDLKGRKALDSIWRDYLSDNSLYRAVRDEDGIVKTHSKDGDFANGVMFRWSQLYEKHVFNLDSLFRVLYRLILWVDTTDEEKLNNESKWFYVSIIRAQLSSIELQYLFLNGLTERGRKFKPLIEKYALFDNFSVESDIAINHLQRVHPLNVQYSKNAFDSELAKAELGI